VKGKNVRRNGETIGPVALSETDFRFGGVAGGVGATLYFYIYNAFFM